MRIKHDSIDIYSQQEQLPEIKEVVVFAEHEYGMASLLAANTILGDREPDAKIMSHLISEMAFNAAPKLSSVGWDLYFEGHTAFLCVTNWPQVALYPPESSKGTWIYTYPVVRDTVDFLKSLGAKNLYYLSSTTVHEALDPEVFEPLSPKILKHYEYGMENEEDNLFFTPPTWMFPYLAHEIGYEHSEAIMSGCADDEKIDKEAGWALANWLSDYMGSDYKLTKSNYNTIVKEFTALVNKHEKLREEVMNTMSALNTSTIPSEHMWG